MARRPHTTQPGSRGALALHGARVQEGLLQAAGLGAVPLAAHQIILSLFFFLASLLEDLLDLLLKEFNLSLELFEAPSFIFIVKLIDFDLSRVGLNYVLCILIKLVLYS